MENNYKPISCNFHDELEAICVLKKKCEIIYSDGEAEKSITGLIKDIITKKDGEFIEMDGGETIRLDKLISVNGLKLSDYC